MNQKTLIKGVIIALGLAFSASSVWAQTSTETVDQKFDILTLKYLGEFSGVGVSEPFRGEGPNADGDFGEDLALDNYIYLKLGFSKNSSFTVRNVFGLNPNTGDITYYDPRFYFTQANIAEAGLFSVNYLSAGFELPLSDGSSVRQRAYSLRFAEGASVKLGQKSRWTVGLQGVQKFWNHVGELGQGPAEFDAAGGNSYDFGMWYYPAISYEVSDAVSVTTEAEIGWVHYSGQEQFQGDVRWDNYPNSQELYVTWGVLKQLELEPFLKVLPQKMSLATTTVGIRVSGSIPLL